MEPMPKKEVVRISLPPKPTNTPTIRLPPLPTAPATTSKKETVRISLAPKRTSPGTIRELPPHATGPVASHSASASPPLAEIAGYKEATEQLQFALYKANLPPDFLMKAIESAQIAHAKNLFETLKHKEGPLARLEQGTTTDAAKPSSAFVAASLLEYAQLLGIPLPTMVEAAKREISMRCSTIDQQRKAAQALGAINSGRITKELEAEATLKESEYFKKELAAFLDSCIGVGRWELRSGTSKSRNYKNSTAEFLGDFTENCYEVIALKIRNGYTEPPHSPPSLWSRLTGRFKQKPPKQIQVDAQFVRKISIREVDSYHKKDEIRHCSNPDTTLEIFSPSITIALASSQTEWQSFKQKFQFSGAPIIHYKTEAKALD